MRRLPVAVLFNSYPLLLDVLEPTLRGEIEIAGRATTTADAARLIEMHDPDLLVAGVEAAAGSEDVFELVRDSIARLPSLKVIAFSSSSDRTLLAEAFDAGVSALIAPNAAPEDIAVAIRQATDPSIHFAPTTLPVRRAAPKAVEDDPGLTDREIETVRLVAKGLSNAEVGRTLLVTEQTVKFHLSNIFRKLNVSNRTQATRRAEMMNLLDETPDVQAQALVQ
jgi:two-component system, NarL family, response regulator DevR